MEANLSFFFPSGTRIGDDEYEHWVKENRDRSSLPKGVSSDNIGNWARQVSQTPYSSGGCYTFSKDGELVLREPNGRSVTWSFGRFPTPWFAKECPFPFSRVEAVVNWWSQSDHYELGDFVVDSDEPEGELKCEGTLELEILSDGRQRYELLVRARDMSTLNEFVSDVRGGKLQETWK